MIPGRGAREYHYDEAERLTGVFGPDGSSSFQYDLVGRLARLESPGGIVSEYLEYDPRGMVRKLKDPENQVFSFQ